MNESMKNSVSLFELFFRRVLYSYVVKLLQGKPKPQTVWKRLTRCTGTRSSQTHTGARSSCCSPTPEPCICVTSIEVQTEEQLLTHTSVTNTILHVLTFRSGQNVSEACVITVDYGASFSDLSSVGDFRPTPQMKVGPITYKGSTPSQRTRTFHSTIFPGFRDSGTLVFVFFQEPFLLLLFQKFSSVFMNI